MYFEREIGYNFGMLVLDVLILGFALAMDAAVASFAYGVLGAHHTKKQKIGGCLYLASLFGFFQFLMLWLGSVGGYHFTFSDYGHLLQLLIIGIFLIIGSKIIIDSFKTDEDDKKMEWSILSTVVVAIATSMDALAAGVSLGTLPQSYLAALEVGGITFLICLLFYFFSQITKSIPDRWLQRVSGLIFVLMGVKILLDYMRLGGLL